MSTPMMCCVPNGSTMPPHGCMSTETAHQLVCIVSPLVQQVPDGSTVQSGVDINITSNNSCTAHKGFGVLVPRGNTPASHCLTDCLCPAFVPT